LIDSTFASPVNFHPSEFRTAVLSPAQGCRHLQAGRSSHHFFDRIAPFVEDTNTNSHLIDSTTYQTFLTDEHGDPRQDEAISEGANWTVQKRE